MNRYTPILIAIAAILAISLALLIDSIDFSPPEPVADTTLVEPPVLITKVELQQILNILGPSDRDPNLVEDGIIGPKTMAAWDKAVNTQYALTLWPEDGK